MSKINAVVLVYIAITDFYSASLLVLLYTALYCAQRIN
jgi:hypothetical protein